MNNRKVSGLRLDHEHKNPELAMKLEKSPEWEELNLNHLEGRTAAFFLYGDQGANEMDASGRPKILRHNSWFNPYDWPWDNDRNAHLPLVLQCRWSGIEVPDELWVAAHSGVGVPYADNQAEDMMRETEVIGAFDAWTDRFAAYVSAKGKVEPGKYRAYGYRAPGHRWADMKLKWRETRIGLGMPRAESSPAKQQELGLNRDVTLAPKEGEGDKLRK